MSGRYVVEIAGRTWWSEASRACQPECPRIPLSTLIVENHANQSPILQTIHIHVESQLQKWKNYLLQGGFKFVGDSDGRDLMLKLERCLPC